MSYSMNGLRKSDSTGVNYINLSNSVHRRFGLYNAVKELLKVEKFDYVYVRYPRSEINFIKLLKSIKESGARIVVEIPTYPYHGEIGKGIVAKTIAAVDILFRTRLKKYVERIVTYSDDRMIFGIETINTINGIIFDNIECKKDNQSQDVISLIGVAAIRSVQGWDRVIKGMNNYYSNGGTRKITFNIVGEGPYLNKYRNLVSEYGLDERVVFHGFQSGADLDRLYNSADIGINSIAIHRDKLKTESTLKTKEYVAKGLPIVSSYPVDAFDAEDHKKYVLEVAPDETPVQIESIINFNDRLKDNPSVALKIREAAQKKCDMFITLERVFDYFDLMGEKRWQKI